MATAKVAAIAFSPQTAFPQFFPSIARYRLFRLIFWVGIFFEPALLRMLCAVLIYPQCFCQLVSSLSGSAFHLDKRRKAT